MRTWLNLGCGTLTRPDCINVDLRALAGVDVVVDLAKRPYPFRSDRFDKVYMISILEHLPDTIGVMEEIHRIAKKDALIHIHVPFWNSYISIVDPTHVRLFHHKTFDFFDPSKPHGCVRSYYSTARFRIERIDFTVPFFGVWIQWPKKNGVNRIPEFLRLKHPLLKGVAKVFAHWVCNIINTMDVYLRVLKP